MSIDEMIDYLHALAQQYCGDDACNKIRLDGRWEYLDLFCLNVAERLKELSKDAE